MAAKNEVPSEVEAALSSPKIEPAPPTLEEAREAPGPGGEDREIEKRIESEGIEYVFFQQDLDQRSHQRQGGGGELVPEGGRPRLPAWSMGRRPDLFTDRQGNYIGFGPQESELAAMADLDTFEALPWDPRVARVYCDCYDTETGELLDADPRQNLKRVAHEVEEELGYSFLCGIEPEMMWMKIPEPGEEPEGVTKPWCYHINQFEQLQPVILDVVAYGKAMGLDMSYGDHEDAPGQLELNFRFDRALRTADNISTYRQICSAVGRKHGLHASFMPKPFTGVSANGHHHHFTLLDGEGNNVFHDPDGPAQLSEVGQRFMGGILDHFRALVCIGSPTGQLLQADVGLRLLGAVYKNYGWQNRTCTGRVASVPSFEFPRSGLLRANAVPDPGRPAHRRPGRGRRELDPGPAPATEHVRPARPRARSSSGCRIHLGDALDALEAEEVVRGAMPAVSTMCFMHYKRDEWERYSGCCDRLGA
jgi:glutamine synthetase